MHSQNVQLVDLELYDDSTTVQRCLHVFDVDAPWLQGTVESLVNTVKKLLDLAVHNQRLSVPQFLTVCSEVANNINERPLGLLPDLDSNINVLTSNCLLIGRATSSNLSIWQSNYSLKIRGRLIRSLENQF